MPRTIIQNQQIRDATRAKLVTSAMVVFATQGYGSSSVRKIATHAQVSPGLLYHYFDGKEALLKAVYQDNLTMLGERMANIASITEPLDRITYVVRLFFNTLQADPSFWQLFFGLRAQPTVMKIIGDDIRMWTNRLRTLFVDCLREVGRSHPEIDARVLYSLIEGTIQQYLLEPETYPLDAVVVKILDLFGA